MEIKQYIDKNVMIIADNGKIFSGKVEDFLYSDENGFGEDSIIVRSKNDLIEFVLSDILHIEEQL